MPSNESETSRSVVAVTMDHDNDDEEDKLSSDLIKKKGFDLDNINELCDIVDPHDGDTTSTTPMIYFCRTGNLTVCRYLISRAADCRTTDRYGFFPMYYAAMHGHLGIMKLLSRDGDAHEDVRKHNRNLEITQLLARLPDIHEDHRLHQRRNWSPLRIAFGQGHFHVVQWLLRNEALSTVSGDDIDDAILRNDLHQDIGLPYPIWDDDRRLTVLVWAHDVVTTHDNFQLLLTGTIVSASSVRRHPKNRYRTRSKRTKVSHSLLEQLNGKSGILELVAEYAGYPTPPQELRTLRQLIRLLTAFIKEVPFVPKNN